MLQNLRNNLQKSASIQITYTKLRIEHLMKQLVNHMK